MKRTRGIVAGLAAVVLAGAACGKDEPAATPGPSPTTAAEPALCPFTGQPVPEGVDAGRPVLAVKIDNAPPARPQAGIEKADIVYEELAEGGITRFIAVFHCGDAERLGPVRSARPVDPDIVQQYKPVLFAYSGGRPEVLNKVKSTQGLVDLEHGGHGDVYRRDGRRPAPHNLYTSTAELREEAGDVDGTAKSGFTFKAPEAAGDAAGASPGASPAAAPAGAGPGATVTFAFQGSPDHKYTYDAASGAYLRFQGLNAAFNTEQGGQVKATNLVFLKVRLGPGAQAPDFTVQGEGPAVVVRGGQSFQGKWSRPTFADPWKLTDASGAEMTLHPGNTWIHIVPEAQAVNVG